MTHTYKISGMTCESCGEKVKQLLSRINGVQEVQVDHLKGEARINMQQHVPTTLLQEALKSSKYKLSEIAGTVSSFNDEEEKKSWLETYQPVLLIFTYLVIVTFLAQLNQPFSWMKWMSHFMAGFFLVFSFFKLLNLRGFADNYATYDIIAKRWRTYSFLYAFAELGLGLLYFTGLYPMFTNAAAFAIMSVSLVGVLQTILNKRAIRCACLGDVFNLPTSTVTVIEDALMIVMSVVTLTWMLL